MSQRFRGSFVHKVDSKGRVSVPSSFRRAIISGDPDSKDGKATVILTWGRAELKGWKCIEGYTVEGAEALYDDLESEDRFDPDRELLELLINAESQEVEVDDNGRMGLRADLRERIGLGPKGGEIKFVAMGQKFQIWLPDEFEIDKARRIAEAKGDPFRKLRGRQAND